MSEIAVEFDRVWKKFRKGESFDSLRDLIPAMTKRLLSGDRDGDLRPREFWAVKDVSFQVKRGEALGIIGPNGAGKSTVLKLLSKILRPNKGSIHVQGRLSALIEIGAGFHPDLTGRENIYLNGAILGMTREEIKRKFDPIVEFSGLEEFIDTPVKRYSSGMYARLGFSVAAHVDPDVLLVDEVLSVGDMQFQEKCLEKMLSFAKGGTTVLFVSHNLAAVSTLCPQTAFLSGGTLRAMGPTSNVMTEYVRSVQAGDSAPSEEVPIRTARLLDESMETIERFSPGQKAYLTFSMKPDVPLEECLLGFIIRRATDDLPVCDYNLPLAHLRPSGQHAGDLQCGLSFQVNLLRGAYIIVLHLYHCPTAKFLGWIRPAAFFSVEETASWQGLAHVNPLLIARESEGE